MEKHQILESLKAVLKAKGMTYADVAEKLEISEQTVKRIFFNGDVTLDRLCKICELIEVSFADIVALAKSLLEPTFELEEAVQSFFVDNPSYFGFYLALRKPMSLDEIEKEHGISRLSSRKFLKQLEELALVQRLEGDRFSLSHAGSLTIKQGPLAKTGLMVKQHVLAACFEQKKAKDEDAYLTCSFRAAAQSTITQFKLELQELFESFKNRCYLDDSRFDQKKLVPFSYLCALGTKISDPFAQSISEI